MSVSQYLSRYSDLDQKALNQVNQTYQHALIVPFYDENSAAVTRLFSQCATDSVLLIAVVNAPDNAPTDARQRTVDLAHTLQQRADTLVIDRCSQHPLPHDKGVGMARKIGTDTALALHADGRIQSPWLYQSDADTILPANYFQADTSACADKSAQGALVFAHNHFVTEQDPQLKLAADLYDLHMQYYQAGLAAAGSAYAYPSLGSAMCVHADSYAQVRGYPQRNAGEDFYLLNKIAKVGGVRYVPHIRLDVEARISHRVPFGTGPALQKIVQSVQDDPTGFSYLSYHPASFTLLANTLEYFAALAQCPKTTCADQRIMNILDTLNFSKVLRRLARQNLSTSQTGRVFAEWCDAFRTLRFIHEARRYYPDQPLLESVSNTELKRRP